MKTPTSLFTLLIVNFLGFDYVEWKSSFNLYSFNENVNRKEYTSVKNNCTKFKFYDTKNGNNGNLLKIVVYLPF